MTEHRFINAAFGKKVDRIPIWIMRQAGRYMKEYQALRGKHSFLELCKIPEQACKVTMLPIDLLGVDAAILFSDILIPVEAMGLELEFNENGPQFLNPVRSESDYNNLNIPDPNEKLHFVLDTIRLVKKELNGKVPLIGFSGAPFTSMSYMIEGGTSKNLKMTKIMIFQNPDLVHKILDKVTESTIQYLNAQIEAGVEALQIFDTWAGLLPYQEFKEFSLKYIEKVISSLNRKDIPIIVFSIGTSRYYQDYVQTNADVISIDWKGDLIKIKKDLGEKSAVQGNVDPYLLYADQSIIKSHVVKLLNEMKAYDGYIFNLGHGVLPDIPFDNVRFLVDTVKEFGVYGN